MVSKKRKIIALAIAIIGGASIATAAFASILQGFQGGTGYGSATTSNVGQALIVASTSPYLTYTFGAASGGVASTSPFTSGQIVIVSGTAISTNGFTTSDFLSSSTQYIATNTGNWAGTWQLKNPSDFVTTSTASTTYVPYTGANANVNLGSHTLSVSGVSNTGNVTTTNISITGITGSRFLTIDTSNSVSSFSGITCSGGQAITGFGVGGISATCSSFLTSYNVIAGTGISVSTTTTSATITNTGVTSFNGSTGAVTGVGSLGGATGTITLSTGLNISANALSVSSTYSSSSISFNIQNATTTAGLNEGEVLVPVNFTATYFGCYTTNGTTTLTVFSKTNLAQTTSTAVLVSSIACNTSGKSTTTFTSSTIPLMGFLGASTTAISGTPSTTYLFLSGYKQ